MLQIISEYSRPTRNDSFDVDEFNRAM
ncbi:MAG: hypothetical protein JWM11_1135, partial [Planctomycetaceae bacterium]|nr:hypothetical protein [Planctomycetaceae bacterium]